MRCLLSGALPGASAILGPHIAVIDALKDMLGLLGYLGDSFLGDRLVQLFVKICVHQCLKRMFFEPFMSFVPCSDADPAAH